MLPSCDVEENFAASVNKEWDRSRRSPVVERGRKHTRVYYSARRFLTLHNEKFREKCRFYSKWRLS